MPLSWTLIAILALGNFAVYGAMSIKEKFAVAKASAVVAERGVTICNLRVDAIEREHNAKVAQGVGEAKRAEDLVTPAPETESELAKLCKASASCRSKGAL